MSISYGEMVAKLAKPGHAIIQSLSNEKAHVWHMASCIMGEAGELADCSDNVNLLEELGDIEFYLEGFRQGMKILLVSEAISIPGDSAFIDPTVGLFVEACHVFDAVKKWLIYEKDVDRDNLELHLSYLEFYMNWIRDENNLTRDQILQANMDKLAKRYGTDYSYSNKAAQERVDKQA